MNKTRDRKRFTTCRKWQVIEMS